MPLTYHEHYTVEDYQHWQGDWELVEGVAYAMTPPPAVSHQRVGARITRQLGFDFDFAGIWKALR